MTEIELENRLKKLEWEVLTLKERLESIQPFEKWAEEQDKREGEYESENQTKNSVRVLSFACKVDS